MVRVGGASWLLAAGLSVGALALTGYTGRDPDSNVYATIAAHLASQPVTRWIAPDWSGVGGVAAGPFREHPAGFFFLPALLARAGYPPLQAAYAVNVLWQLGALLLLVRVAAVFVSWAEARAVFYALLVIPIAFVFRVRANHEWAVLFWFAAALYGAERSRASWWWSGVMAIAVAATFLIKGIFAAFVLAACTVWLLVRGFTLRSLVGLLVAAAAGFAAALLYESAYRAVTGESFFAYYSTIRLGPALGGDGRPAAFLRNVPWYLGRLLWFAFPWSLLALAAGFLRPSRFTGCSGLRRVLRGSREPDNAARHGAWFVAVLTAVYIVVLSGAAVRAERFIFPIYFLVAAAGAVVALRRIPAAARVAGRLDPWWPAAPAALWAALCLLRIALGQTLPWLKVR